MHKASGGGIGNVRANSGLVEMAMGYARGRALCAAAQLGIADLLGDDGKNVDQLAVECAADAGSLYRLLRALASFGIVAEIRPQYFTLTRLGAPLQKAAADSAWPAIIFWADAQRPGGRSRFPLSRLKPRHSPSSVLPPFLTWAI